MYTFNENGANLIVNKLGFLKSAYCIIEYLLRRDSQANSMKNSFLSSL